MLRGGHYLVPSRGSRARREDRSHLAGLQEERCVQQRSGSQNARTGQGMFTDQVGKQGISLRTTWAPCTPGAGTALERSP